MAKIGASKNAYNLWTIGLQSSWELDLWGYLRHQKNAAKAQVEAQLYDAEQIKISICAELARNYVLLRSVQTQHSIWKDIVQIDQNSLNIYRNKQRHGVATNVDIANQQINLNISQQKINALNQQISILKNNLAQLINLAPKELDVILQQQHQLNTPQNIPIGFASDFVKNRPDILRADAELRASIETVHAAKADFYPRIGISAQIGKQAFSLTDYAQWDSRMYGIGPYFHLPIFEGGQLKSTLALTEAHQKQAAITYQKTVLNAWHEIDQAFINYQYSQQDEKLIQQQFMANKKNYQTAIRQLQQGTADKILTLSSQKIMAQTQLLYIENQTAMQLSIVALYRSLGAEGAHQYTNLIDQGKSE